MPHDNDDPKADEIVTRVLLRERAEMIGPFAKPHMDEEDFLRRKRYRTTGQPENGMSLLRKNKSLTSTDVYEYIGSKKHMGTAECLLSELKIKGLRYKVSGKNREHISLRCPDCDMVDLPQGICKPTSAPTCESCPLEQSWNQELTA